MLKHPKHPALTSLAGLATLAVLASCGAGGGEEGTAFNDTVPPLAGVVRDGLGADIDTQNSTSTISANWSDFVDDSGFIVAYEWAIGTVLGGTEVQNWVAVGVSSSATNNTLVLEDGRTYFCMVRAYDESGNVSVIAASDGVTIDEQGAGGSGEDPPGGGGGGEDPPGGGGGEDPPGGGGGDPPTPPETTLASSITQFGVTWQFSEAESVGQFANGDWWVVGPVDIVSISPNTQVVGGRRINGSMINPGPAEILSGNTGYDSDLDHVNSLNVAIGVSAGSPLTLSAGTSLISAVSWTNPFPPANASLSPLQTCAILTVLADPAPVGSFRPPYAGNDKTIRHNEADLNYSLLASLAPAANMPDFNSTVAGFERPWLDHKSSWGSRYMHPSDNMPDYGRDLTSLYGTGALMLHLDIPNSQKRDLLVRLVQIGIDFYGNVQNGGYWDGVGGQCSGRKFPILLAGKMLNDAPMLSIGTTHPSGYYGPNHPNNASQFGEDCQTFLVQETSPGVINWGHGGYGPGDIGLAEWGNAHTTFPENDNSDWNWDPYRRCCTGNAWVGQTLVCHIMNLDTAWNHSPYFLYMDRFMAYETPGDWTRSWEVWQGNMWDAYRSTF